jgi:hypothetical protein
MPATTIRKDEFVTMFYYPESKILHHQMHKFFFGQTFRDIMNTATDVFQKYGVQKWLADDTAVTAWTKEDQEWGSSDWFPRALKSGWRYWAIIMPQNTLGQLAVKRVAEKYAAHGIQTRTFSSVDEAKKWLESCK